MTKQCYILIEEELKELLEKSIKYDILHNSDWLDEDIYHAIDSWRMDNGNPDDDLDEAFDKEIDKELLQYKKDGNYVLPKVTRCDVIINGERDSHKDILFSLSIQDDGRTLKVFIDTPLPDEAFDHVIQKYQIIRELLDMTKDYRK